MPRGQHPQRLKIFLALTRFHNLVPSLTNHLTIGRDHRDFELRSTSRSPGRVDHSPSPESNSSDNASSYPACCSDSELDEPRYQTRPGRQREFLSPTPAPRKKKVRQEIVVRSEYGSQQGVFEKYAEETGTEEVSQRKADRHQGLRQGLKSSHFHQILQMQHDRPRETHPRVEIPSEEQVGGTEEAIEYQEPRRGLQKSVFSNNFLMEQDRAKENLYMAQTVASSSIGAKQVSTVTHNFPFPCDMCPCGFRKDYDLRYHNRHTHHTDLYECIKCNEKFIYQRDLLSHRQSHGQSGTKKPRPTTSPSSVITETSKAFSCTQCTATFKQKGHLSHHNRIVHETNLYTCSRGKKGFTYRRDLKQHIEASCSDGKTRSTSFSCTSRPLSSVASPVHRCEMCPSVFRVNGKGNLNSHYRHVHGTRLYKCFKCDLDFKWKREYKIHGQTGCEDQTREPQMAITLELCPSVSLPPNQPFRCTICSFVFQQMKDLTQHRQEIHFSTLHQCSTCSKVFNSNHDLLEHRRASCFIMDTVSQQPDFDTIEPPPAVWLQGDASFNPFQPRSRGLDLQLMSSAEKRQVAETLGIWASGSDKEKQNDQELFMPFTNLEKQNGALRQIEMVDKSVYAMTGSSNNSSSSPLPLVGDVLWKQRNADQNEMATEGKYKGKEQRPRGPIVLITTITTTKEKNKDRERGGQIGVHMNNDIDGCEYKLGFSGKKQRLEKGSSNGDNELVLMGVRGDYDSEQEFEFPSKKRKLQKRVEYLNMKEEGT